MSKETSLYNQGLVDSSAAATELKLSKRHFTRLAEEANVVPYTRGLKQFWSPEQLEEIRDYQHRDRGVVDPADKDPSINAVDARGRETVRCPLFAERIGREQCQAQCSRIAVNMETCSARNCPSPFRLCVHCLRQGYRGNDAVAEDPITGKCNYHYTYGIQSNRKTVSPQLAPPPEVVLEKEETSEGRIIVVDPRRVRPFKDQPRTYFDPMDLAALEKSIFHRGQLQPGIVRDLHDGKHDYELIDGQRRWHACMAIGMPFKAVLTQPKDAEDQFEMSIAANFQRAEHTPMEIAKAIDRLITKGNRSEIEVGVIMGRHQTWVTGYRRMVKLHPDIQALMDPSIPEKERLPVGIAQQLAHLSHKEQIERLSEIKASRMNNTQAVHHIKMHREKSASIGGGTITRRTSERHFFDVLFGHAKRATQQSDFLVGRCSPDELHRLFRYRPDGKEKILREIRAAIAAFTRLHETISGKTNEQSA